MHPHKNTTHHPRNARRRYLIIILMSATALLLTACQSTTPDPDARRITINAPITYTDTPNQVDVTLYNVMLDFDNTPTVTLGEGAITRSSGNATLRLSSLPVREVPAEIYDNLLSQEFDFMCGAVGLVPSFGAAVTDIEYRDDDGTQGLIFALDDIEELATAQFFIIAMESDTRINTNCPQGSAVQRLDLDLRRGWNILKITFEGDRSDLTLERNLNAATWIALSFTADEPKLLTAANEPPAPGALFRNPQLR